MTPLMQAVLDQMTNKPTTATKIAKRINRSPFQLAGPLGQLRKEGLVEKRVYYTGRVIRFGRREVREKFVQWRRKPTKETTNV
jgi:Mn-dependent DtxR family transcriptional regulator